MMLLKLFSFVFVSLLLAVVASASPDEVVSTASPTIVPQPTTDTFPPTAIVDPYVLRAVGEGGNTGRPYGTVVSTTPLTLVTFFEAHQSHFETGINEALTIEVYANVPEGQDCMTGTLLESVGEEFTLTTEATPYDEYNTEFPGLTGSSVEYPVTSEGQVGAATVTISDFQYTPTDVNKNIWFPGRGDKDGDIELCVVTALKIDDDNNNGDDKEYYVSHMDSRKTISIDLMAKMEAVLYMDVDTFLCNNKHEPVRQEKKYTSGQNFRICVGPTEEGVHNGYKVDNYLELICDGRPLILPEVTVDAEEEIGYKNNKLAIRSALTAQDALEGKARITCTGKVALSYTAPTTAVRALRGDLHTSRGLVPSEAAAADELLEGLFEVTIEMDTPSNESSSAPFPSSMTTTVAVIIGFGSLLSVISSLIW